ncbi:MAG TPA: hypothetical protein VGI42_03440, partial [Chthoniobacterales bacterium]
MQRFALPFFIALTALLAGIAIGRYTFSPAAGASHRAARVPAQSSSIAPNSSAISAPKIALAPNDSAPAPIASSDSIISKIKTALLHPGSGHTYATFSKLAESVDATNVRDVLAFVQTLSKPQEKSMLVSLFVGRWAELDPPAAIAYAQTIPPGIGRNWAITGAIGGWAEHDPNAAEAWAQQLPPGPA